MTLKKDIVSLPVHGAEAMQQQDWTKEVMLETW